MWISEWHSPACVYRISTSFSRGPSRSSSSISMRLPGSTTTAALVFICTAPLVWGDEHYMRRRSDDGRLDGNDDDERLAGLSADSQIPAKSVRHHDVVRSQVVDVRVAEAE